MNWGILATGKIATSFARALQTLPDATLLAVASRSQESADAFGDEFNVPRRYASYEALAADPDIEVIYVATPHNFHYENTLLCLNAGKHVLCEKAFALNGQQVREMIETAQRQRLFLAEAMWMWHIPATVRFKELIEAGEIGTPQVLGASFGFTPPFDRNSRLFNPTLGGGTLLDIGIYPLALALYLFGKPQRVTGQVTLGSTGVDEQMTATLEYADGKIANFTASFRARLPNEAFVGGSKGHMRLHASFWNSEQITVATEREYTLEVPFGGNGLRFEAEEAMARIREGAQESRVMRWQDSIDLMEMMDTLRAQWQTATAQGL